MADQAATTERVLKRRHLMYYLEVFDDRNNELLGHLVNLTVQGLMLLSREKIEPGKEYTLKMIMPEELSKERHVIFHAKSMWCRPDVNPDFYATGFEASDLSQETKDLFIFLIDLVGFND